MSLGRANGTVVATRKYGRVVVACASAPPGSSVTVEELAKALKSS